MSQVGSCQHRWRLPLIWSFWNQFLLRSRGVYRCPPLELISDSVGDEKLWVCTEMKRAGEKLGRRDPSQDGHTRRWRRAWKWTLTSICSQDSCFASPAALSPAAKGGEGLSTTESPGERALERTPGATVPAAPGEHTVSTLERSTQCHTMGRERWRGRALAQLPRIEGLHFSRSFFS